MPPELTPPYYAVIFISRLAADTTGYAESAERMLQLAREMPGFLGFESAREEVGVSVSFWRDHASIANWRRHSEHLQAQSEGRQRWYDDYDLHIARVERCASFRRDTDQLPEPGVRIRAPG